jgi:AcrR family transcriptional regulator
MARTVGQSAARVKAAAAPPRPARGRPAGTGAAAKKRVAAPNGETGTKILDAALNLFVQSNYWSVTIKDIGRATGLNTAMIYYYFQDKEDLFRATVERAVKHAFVEFETRTNNTQSAEEVISGWLDTHIEQLDLIRKFVKISLDYASSNNRIMRIDKAISAFYDHERSILTAAIKSGIAQGYFRLVDAEQLARFISTFLDGVMARSMVLPKFDAIEAINELRGYVLGQLLV